MWVYFPLLFPVLFLTFCLRFLLTLSSLCLVTCISSEDVLVEMHLRMCMTWLQCFCIGLDV